MCQGEVSLPFGTGIFCICHSMLVKFYDMSSREWGSTKFFWLSLRTSYRWQSSEVVIQVRGMRPVARHVVQPAAGSPVNCGVRVLSKGKIDAESLAQSRIGPTNSQCTAPVNLTAHTL